eukprot:5748600-Amphidinium_carterae.1
MVLSSTLHQICTLPSICSSDAVAEKDRDDSSAYGYPIQSRSHCVTSLRMSTPQIQHECHSLSGWWTTD